MKLDLSRIQKAIAEKRNKKSAEPVKIERQGAKASAKSNAKPISKEETEAKVARIKTMAKEAQDITEGQAEFGKDYKELGLKLQSKGVKQEPSGEVTVKRTFTNSTGNDGVTEVVNKAYGGDVLKVKRTSPKVFGSGTETEEFLETPEQRKKRVYEEGRARAMAIVKKAQSQKPQEPTKYMSDENVAKIAEALKKQKDK